MPLKPLLVFMLLLIPYVGSGQVSSVPAPLLERVQEVQRLLKELKAHGDSLVAVPKVLQDSLNLKISLDSLSALGLDSAFLHQKKDSLLQAYSARQLAMKAQREAEEQLKKELSRAQEAVVEGLLPKEAEAVLRDIQTLSDPKALQERVLAAGKAKIPDILGEAGRKAQAVQKQVAKAAGVLDEAKKVQELRERLLKVDPLKNADWRHRLVAGTLWQFGYQEGRYNLDLAPILAWRFTGLLSLGAGFQYRVSLGPDARSWLKGQDKVLGYLVFGDFQIKEGFFGRLHYEHLSMSGEPEVPESTALQDGREWVPGVAVGLGKEFKVYGPLQGYLLAQYNILHKSGEISPYLSPVQVKAGLSIAVGHIFKKSGKSASE